MSDQRYAAVVSDVSDLSDLVGSAIEKATGLTCLPFNLDARVDEVLAEKGQFNISVVILFTQHVSAKDNRGAESIRAQWQGLFPEVPIIWYTSEDNAFYGVPWKNVRWCSSDRYPHESFRDPQVFDQFTTNRRDKKSGLDMLLETIQSALK